MRQALTAAAAIAAIAAAAGQANADPANIGKVIITEIFANPDGPDNAEFIEIFNTTNDPIDISGWVVRDEDSVPSIPFPPGTILGPRQALAIVGANFALRPNDPDNPGQYLPTTPTWTPMMWQDGWGNSGNVLVLAGSFTIANTPTLFNEVPFILDADGTVVDVVNYQNGVNGWPPTTNARSYVLLPQFLNHIDNDDGRAWVLATQGELGAAVSQQVFYFADPDGIPGSGDEISFEIMRQGNVASPGFVDDNVNNAFRDCNGNGIDDAIEIFMGLVGDCNFDRIPDDCEIDCNANGIPDNCEFANLPERDCNRNGILDDCEIAQDPSLDLNGDGIIDGCEDINKIIITEIMIDPFTSPEMEWVELYNRSNETVDVSGWRLADIEQNGDPLTFPIPEGTFMAPGEVLVLCFAPNDPNISIEDIERDYKNAWGQNIRFVPLRRWGARAQNGTQTAEILALIRGAIVDDSVNPPVVTFPGFIVDIANYSNGNSNNEPLNGWPQTDGHGSFYLIGTALDASANNQGTNWRLAIEGLDGVFRSGEFNSGEPLPTWVTNFGNDFGSPGFVSTAAPELPTGQIVITEIYFTSNGVFPGDDPMDPEARAPINEFVEIYNTTNQTIDLTGWYLQDEDGRTTGFPSGSVLLPGQVGIIIGQDDVLANPNPVQDFYDAWGCGYPVFVVGDWYTNNGYQGIARLANDPSPRNEILRIVRADGTPSDIVNYDDDGTPTGAAVFPFGWPADAVGFIETYWSSYILPPSFLAFDAYNAEDNDFGIFWAASFVDSSGFGFDGARVNNITPVFNAPSFASPGYLEGVTGPVSDDCDPVTPCPCDFNNNGLQEIGDYFSFLTAFFAQLNGQGSADFDNDGTVTIGDYFAFLSCLPAIAASTTCP